MGINCCSHANEPPEITILKPETNMTSKNKNPAIDNQNNDMNNNQQQEILVVEQTKPITSTNITNDEFNNAFFQPFDPNTLYNTNNNNNEPLAFNKNELDALFNQGFKTVGKNISTEGNINKIVNNNINIEYQNNNTGLNIDELLNQQNEEIKYIQNNNLNIINNQIKNNAEMNHPLGQKQKNQITTIAKNIKTTVQIPQNNIIYQPVQNNQISNTTAAIKNVENIQNRKQINNELDIDSLLKNASPNQNKQIVNNGLDINTLLKNVSSGQNIQNQPIPNNQITTTTKITKNIETVQKNQPENNDLDIDALLKNSAGQNFHTNANMNFDVFFSQDNNNQISDDLFDKLFESAGKPIIQNNNSNQNNLYMSQRIGGNNQIKAQNLNNGFSPVNSPQRSEISEPVNPTQVKQLW